MMVKDPNLNDSVSILGLGNVFLGDDGFGPLTVETFRYLYECGSNVEISDLGALGLDLAPYLYGRKLVVIVDAVHAEAPVGTLLEFCEDDFSSSQASLRITGHDPGLWDTLVHLRLAGGSPSELIVIGAVPESCIFGDGISEVILALASEAAASIARILLHRGVVCIRRETAAQPNLWWLPKAALEDARNPKAHTNA
jgi:hydrogenase maturation protease